MSGFPTLSTETQVSEDLATACRDARVPGLTLLYHPQLERIGERVALLSLGQGGEALLSRREPGFSVPGGGALRPLDHPSISRRPLRLDRDGDGFRLDLRASRTRVEAEGEPVAGQRTFGPAEVERGVVLRLGPHVVVLLHWLDPLGRSQLPSYGLVGDSIPLESVRSDIQKVSDLRVSVLLRGETGCGKELVARAIHGASTRRREPFVAVNMAALPPALAAAELFGSTRGAYTGADRQRKGLFLQADGGTLFLDEIAETPPDVQALLLRALETGEVRPVGGDAPRRVDVRLISATDADLEADIADERFRAPLLHRLAGFELHLPPLRQRRDDFGRLFLHFLRRELETVGEAHRLDAATPWLSARLVARLATYDWPGNVRQLLNVTRQIVIANRGEPVARLPEAVATLLATAAAGAAGSTSAGAATAPAVEPPRVDSPVPPPAGAKPPGGRIKPADLGDDELLGLLRDHRFNVRATAAAAGISPTSLYQLIESSPRLRKPAEIGRAEIEASLGRTGGDVDAAAFELEVSGLGLKRRLKELGIDTGGNRRIDPGGGRRGPS